MSRGRSKVLTVCASATCRKYFYPWIKARKGPPTCSVKCARDLGGFNQRGKTMTAANAGRRAHAAKRIELMCLGEFGPFTDRERLIFLRGFKAGYDRGFPASWRKRTPVVAA